MVTPNARRNRGQVILIGAITLAFILLGIVVVFNGVLYTETLSESATSQSTADAEVVEQEVERNLVEIAHRWNLETGPETNPSKFKSIDNSGEFAYQYRNTTANSRSTIVSIESNRKDTANVVRNETSGSVNISSDRVGSFVLDLDADSNDHIGVKTSNSSVTINSPDSDSFNINGCEINGEDVRFDLVTGDTNIRSESCDEQLKKDLSIINNNDPEITFSGDLVGNYYIIAKNMTVHSPSSPEDWEGIWSLEAVITYKSSDVSFQRDDTINVYGDNE